ncbi:MAG: hypothetical protein Kow0077_23160 [Anaerolineae bacterium]
MLRTRWFLLAAGLALLLCLTAWQTAAQTDERLIDAQFEVLDGPVLARGEPGAWDSGFVIPGEVIYADGRFHMFYTGGTSYTNEPWAIGYASSEDGIHWVRYIGNPIIERCRSPFDCGLSLGAVLREEEQWVAYLNPHRRAGILPGRQVLRATASAPTGPWIVDRTPVLEGARGSWDHYLIADDVIRTADGYRLYFTGWDRYLHPAVGLATSEDGITFTKYRDPDAVTFARCTPILETTGETSPWDAGGVQTVSVWHTEDRWDLFYYGTPNGDPASTLHAGIGYAFSTDGIHWNRYCENPVVTLEGEQAPWRPVALAVDDTMYLYYAIRPDDSMTFEVGLAVGQIELMAEQTE